MKNKKILLVSILIIILLAVPLFIYNNQNNKVESTINIYQYSYLKSGNIDITIDLNKDNKIVQIKGDNNELNNIKGKNILDTTKIISNYIASKTNKTEQINLDINYNGKSTDIDNFINDIEKDLKTKNPNVDITREKNNNNNESIKYKCNATLEYEKTTYDGKNKTPSVKVTCDNTEINNSLYKVSYTNNINAGLAKAIIKINGKYNKEITKNFTINKATASIGNCTYPRANGNNQNIVTGGVGVKYTNNIKKEVGNYEVTITLDSNYYWSDNYTGNTKKIVCPINMTSNNNPIDIYFLNTTNPKSKEYAKYANESILIVTKEGKTVVIDTSDNENYPDILYSYLKQIQNKDQVIVDYMIISHAHNDHYYGLKYLNENNNITKKIKIDKIYYKANTNYEKKRGLTSIINSLKKKNIINTIIPVNNMSENSIIKIDNQNSLHLFNLNDVFSKLDCNITGNIQGVYFRKYSNNQNTSDLICSNKECNKYYYIDIDEPHTIKKDALYNNGNLNNYWYAYIKNMSSEYICNENTNSIAILVETKTNNGSKYTYIPSDLENNAYSPIGEYNKYIANEWYLPNIYGSSWFLFDENLKIKQEVCTSNKKCINISKYKIAAESRVANRICNLLTKNKCKDEAAREQLKNIVIYQQSHHGYNNVLDAVKTLRLNRTNLYSVITTSGKALRDKTGDFAIARTCAKNSKNTKMRSIGSTVSGFPSNTVGAVRCHINSAGAAYCDGYAACDNQSK